MNVSTMAARVPVISGIIYVTVNLVNEKGYVGIHTLGKKSYLGSGKCLNKAIHKYGRKNFKRIDIVTFETLEEGLDLERYRIRELNTLV